MELKEGMICKHFKGETLIEKNIYEIISVNPEYTGVKELSNDIMIIYRPVFQEEKCFIREYDDLTLELSEEEKEKYHQSYRIEPLTEEELDTIDNPVFIKKKLEYLEEKYGCKKQL